MRVIQTDMTKKTDLGARVGELERGGSIGIITDSGMACYMRSKPINNIFLYTFCVAEWAMRQEKLFIALLI